MERPSVAPALIEAFAESVLVQVAQLYEINRQLQLLESKLAASLEEHPDAVNTRRCRAWVPCDGHPGHEWGRRGSSRYRAISARYSGSDGLRGGGCATRGLRKSSSAPLLEAFNCFSDLAKLKEALLALF